MNLENKEDKQQTKRITCYIEYIGEEKLRACCAFVAGWEFGNVAEVGGKDSKSTQVKNENLLK
jgi:hypothetical protein